jgi:hypothetical protein
MTNKPISDDIVIKSKEQHTSYPDPVENSKQAEKDRIANASIHRFLQRAKDRKARGLPSFKDQYNKKG